MLQIVISVLTKFVLVSDTSQFILDNQGKTYRHSLDATIYYSFAPLLQSVGKPKALFCVLIYKKLERSVCTAQHEVLFGD